MTRPDAGVGLPRKVTTNMAYQHLPMSFTSNHFTGHQHEPPHLLSLLTRHILSSRFFSPSLPLLGRQGCALAAKTGLCRVSSEKEMFRGASKSCSLSMLAYPSEWDANPRRPMWVRYSCQQSLSSPRKPPPTKVQSIPCTSAMWVSSLSLASSRWKTLPGIPVCRPTLA